MKPNFALSLSFDGIRLLHRAAGGWRLVGEVALDAPDMAGELSVLRKTASSLEPGGVRAKLLLPNEQIKYLTLDTPDMAQDARRAAAATALDGATPYPVSDLVFDVSAQGDQTHVAAVAKETLAEAEAFAVEHRFHPVSFAAVPGPNPYLGEPYFGQTRAADSLLDEGEQVEPDGIAVVVVGDARPQDAGPVAEDRSDLEPETKAKTSPADDPFEDILPAASAPAAPLTDLPPDRPDTPVATAPPESPKEPPVAETAKPPPKITVEDAPAKPPQAPPLKAAPEPAAPATPIVADKKASGFSSRRSPRKLRVPKDAPRREPGLSAGRTSPQPAHSVPAVSVTAGELAIEPDSASLAPATPAPKSGFLSRRKQKFAGTAPPRVAPAPVPASGDASVAASEEDWMTIFGARKPGVGGKPRFLGLILTAVLLVLLAGVAAWASVFLDDGKTFSRLFGNGRPDVATAPVQPDPPAIAQEDETIQTTALDPGLSAEDGAVLDALRTPILPEVQELTADELAERYAVTGIWPVAPVVPPEPAGLIDLDDLYLTSIDPVSTANDAVALPGAAAFATDLSISAPGNPTAPGTQFAFDARGLVIPTAQGALTPEGILVYLGRPPAVPPATPTRFQSEPEDTAVRDALALVRPRPRPGDLAETTQRAQLGGLTRSELADYRPELRPRSLQEEAALSAAPVDPQDTDNAVTAALAAAPAIQNATRFATQSSRRPDTRPRNFARIVKRAEANRTAEVIKVASAAATAPRVVTPKIPSKASVSRAATVKNAINLRKVNLIGVYGKPSKRRALVRLSNGRYKKVVVGDRLDGGRVSAIGDGELRYVKSGRNMVLKMPR